MRVNPSSNNTSVDPLRAAGDGPKSGAKAEALSGTSGEVASFTRSSDLSRLLSALKEQPDVRDDAVVAAAIHLAAGDYHTSAAAAETATAIDDANNVR